MANTINNIVVNDKNRTIEMSKTFAKMAHQYGTAEYDDLQAVRKDYPRYREVIVKPSRKNDTFKGLNKSFMRQYIARHDDENKTTMNKFKKLIGEVKVNKDDGEIAMCASFFEVKKWFLATYPKIEQYVKDSQDAINAILKEVA